MTNPLVAAAKIWGKKMCVCGALIGTGAVGTVVVTPMVTKPAMPASYIAPRPPLKVGIVTPHVKKQLPLCQPTYFFGGDADVYGGGKGGGTVSAPEPSTLALMALPGILLLRRKRWTS